MQNVALGHDIPPSELPAVISGPSDQVEPSKVQTLLSLHCWHAVSDSHMRSPNLAGPAPLGTGVVQLDPSKVAMSPELSSAMQNVPDAQESAERVLPSG